MGKFTTFAKSIKDDQINRQKEYHKRRKEVDVLFKQTGGILLVSILLFSAFKSIIIDELCSTLWSKALSHASQQFITTSNLFDVLKSPVVCITGIGIFLILSFFTLWHTSIILTCAEYAYQRKTIKFFWLFRESFLNIIHCLNPKNWLIFILTSILLPLLDLYSMSLNAFKVPLMEYFFEFCRSRIWLTIVLILCVILLYIFLIKSFFIFCRFILYKEDFFTALKHSIKMTKGKRRNNIVQVSIYKIITRIYYTIIPTIALATLLLIFQLIFRNNIAIVQALNLSDVQVIGPFLEILSKTLITITSLLLFEILFHDNLKTTDSPMPTLNQKAIKGPRKNKSFKLFIIIAYVIVIVLTALYVLSVSFNTKSNPETINSFIMKTSIAAHKGDCDKAVENTKESIENALNSGKNDYIEVDVRLTKDNVPVIWHDETTEKYTMIPTSISDMTYEEFKNLSLSPIRKKIFNNATFISLDEALNITSGKIPLIIEIKPTKDNNDIIASNVVSIINKHNDTISYVQSTSYDTICKIKELDPSIKTGIVMVFSTGNFYDTKNVDFYSIEHSFINQTDIDMLHSRGKKIAAWTVNDSNDMVSLAARKVDLIITDQTSKAYNLMNATK